MKYEKDTYTVKLWYNDHRMCWQYEVHARSKHDIYARQTGGTAVSEMQAEEKAQTWIRKDIEKRLREHEARATYARTLRTFEVVG